MVSMEELQDILAVKSKIFMFDNFPASDHISTGVTGSGEVAIDLRNMALRTQVISPSTAHAYYTRMLFNPRYSRLLMRLTFNSDADLFAYFGFRSNVTAPAWHMNESHAGFMYYQGTLYAVSGDGDSISPSFQVTPITDIDIRRDILYEIKGEKFRWYSIPHLIPYFGEAIEPAFEKIKFRKWSPVYTNGSAVPMNQTHYIYLYVENLTNFNKMIEVRNICYQEEYSD